MNGFEEFINVFNFLAQTLVKTGPATKIAARVKIMIFI
jgi:hypothetical protein